MRMQDMEAARKSGRKGKPIGFASVTQAERNEWVNESWQWVMSQPASPEDDERTRQAEHRLLYALALLRGSVPVHGSGPFGDIHYDFVAAKAHTEGWPASLDEMEYGDAEGPDGERVIGGDPMTSPEGSLHCAKLLRDSGRDDLAALADAYELAAADADNEWPAAYTASQFARQLIVLRKVDE